jgi:hypothetical protein
MSPAPEGREDASARLGGWGRTARSQSSRSLCEGVTWGPHTSAQLPRVDALTRAAGERKRLDQEVEYAFRGRPSAEIGARVGLLGERQRDGCAVPINQQLGGPEDVRVITHWRLRSPEGHGVRPGGHVLCCRAFALAAPDMAQSTLILVALSAPALPFPSAAAEPCRIESLLSWSP